MTCIHYLLFTQMIQFIIYIHIYSNVSIYYSSIWILDPSLLAIISFCLLILALVDYLVPILTSLLCNAQSWTGQKEKKLIEICQSLSATMTQIENMWTSFARIRVDRPNSVSVLSSLIIKQDNYHSCLTEFFISCTVLLCNDHLPSSLCMGQQHGQQSASILYYR